MRSWFPDVALLTLAAASLLTAAVRWERTAVPPVIDVTLADPPREGITRASPDSVAAVAAGIARRNPFRLSNRPAALRHGEQPASEAPVAPKYRPALVLKAIVGGPPWSALVDGLPGIVGSRVVAPGERIDSIDVRRISRDSVVLRGPDTTWVLTVGRRP